MARFLLRFDQVIGGAAASIETVNETEDRAKNEAELSGLSLLAVFASVTTIPILAPVGYSLARVSYHPGDYLRLRELLSQELVDDASTTRGRPAALMLCTIFSVSHNALISSDFRRIRDKCERDFFRLNLEQFRIFVKHWVAQLIRPEEETRRAGDPT
jgi:hypothetical protein